ncbi:hypothetical protein ABT034_02030 [Streptomyces sp. NPDC002773]|uniref:hypothetical protein n=1 Tax=Streptomyces sp. NPDC002773 TaxID=3154430 RepID=UPI0033253B8E
MDGTHFQKDVSGAGLHSLLHHSTYSPPGTSKEVDCRVLGLDIPEGDRIESWFGDEPNSSRFDESKRGFA